MPIGHSCVAALGNEICPVTQIAGDKLYWAHLTDCHIGSHLPANVQRAQLVRHQLPGLEILGGRAGEWGALVIVKVPTRNPTFVILRATRGFFNSGKDLL